MTKLRFGLVSLVALMFGIMGGNSANAAYQYTYKIVVIDKCVNGKAQMYYDGGTYRGDINGVFNDWPYNDNCRDGTTSYHAYCQSVSAVCGQNASLDQTSGCGHGVQDNIFKMAFNSDVDTTNFLDCGKWHLYGSKGDDFGEYVVCWANRNYSGVTGVCTNFGDDATACDSSYIGTVPTINKVYITSTTAPSLTAKAASPIYTVIENPQHTCCTSGTCNGYTDWVTHSSQIYGDACEWRHPKTCSYTGTCSVGTNQTRCKAGYYATQNNTGGIGGSSGCSASYGLGCTACPSADSGWSGPTSLDASYSYTQCYEYQGSGALNCDDGEVRRWGTSATGYGSPMVHDTLVAMSNQYVDDSNAYPYCVSCPNATASYTSSTNQTSSTLIQGKSDLDSSQSIPISQCYLQSGTYHDSKGTFTLSSNCSYSTTATSNLL